MNRSLTLILSILFSFSILAGGTGRIITAGDDRVPNEYIVVFDDDVLPDHVPDVARVAVHGEGVKIRKMWTHALKGIVVEMSEEKAQAVSRHPRVKYVEENALTYLASSHSTPVNPVTCVPTDPTNGNCSPTPDNRLWHLDRIDQNYADPTNAYSYCRTGAGRTVYIVDTGVNTAHQEFALRQGETESRVKVGYNATVEKTVDEDGNGEIDDDGDGMPANDPCFGFALPPLHPDEDKNYGDELFAAGHGTAAASVLGGNRIGVAKNVNIVPIKVARCDRMSARKRVSSRFYRLHETMFRVSGSAPYYYRATQEGTTASAEAPPEQWPTSTSDPEFSDGGVKWKVFDRTTPVQTTEMFYDGLNWVLTPANPNPQSHAVVSMSTYRRLSGIGVPPNDIVNVETMEGIIRNLLQANITVIASANNQNGDACKTSPARMSIETSTNKVITVGGTMLVNRPWDVNISDAPPGSFEADGVKAGTNPPVSYGLEPAFDSSKPVKEARWICGAGDSATCSNSSPTQAVSPVAGVYGSWNGGSNSGPCVTIFAPAKNIPVAHVTGADKYRDPRLRYASASGTSWSAPIVAGVAAMLLEADPTATPAGIRQALIDASVPSLDPVTLNSYNHEGVQLSGTPNRSLRIPGGVNITTNPISTAATASGTADLTLAASGASLTYQWYEVTHPNFDFTKDPSGSPRNGAHWDPSGLLTTSMPISGATSETFNAPASAYARAYWARVTSAMCGSADSNIAVVVPRPTAPGNVSALASRTSVSLSWSAASGTISQYQIERKSAGGSWSTIGTVASNILTYTDAVPPGGMPVYRVLSASGGDYLDAANLATTASVPDYANRNASAYVTIVAGTTPIRAQHMIELRQAVNDLSDAAGVTRPYSTTDLEVSNLQGIAVHAAHFNSLLANLNSLRTNELGMSEVHFTQPPSFSLTITSADIGALRDMLK